MKTKPFFYFLLFTVAFGSCKKDSTSSATTGSEPKSGSTWVYKVTNYNEAGTAISSANMTVKGVEVTVSGSKWLALVDQATTATIISIQKKSDGWWYMPAGTTSTSLWYKNPAALNDTYTYVYGTCTVKGITTSVTVPAGTYSCTYVEGNDTNSLEDVFWFAPNEVLVKFDTYDEKAAGPPSNVYKKQSLELVSYTP